MNNKVTLSAMVLMAGCAQTVTPNYDMRFGDAVRDAKLAMTIDPDAGARGDQARGIDGQAAHEATRRYQKSFTEPPPVTNVINIGGRFGSGSGGSDGGEGR